ncbi:glutamate ABC transporter substrate-binding protein [Gordonia hydrophobica]|uniref:Glutamate ABC transporter substrate-binding protein n=1 Tax=Gordonia hydrophobica TaxID=40516 RepID=A0ABZ2U6I4_9ACTN|nr:glutamate ABC transporter substrate-binding protein [Gordonia hydrophobica]MBM7365549.1 polar amino acid transport system substrate-binding protein [Gordonia hydrophobica]
MTATRFGTPAGLAVIALVALLTLTGCNFEPTAAGDPPTAIAHAPLPPNVQYGVDRNTPSTSTDCDTTSSLRPTTMPEPRRMPARSTMARIAERGRLIVGTDLGSNPLSFRDPITGDVKGFDIDVAHWIADAIFGDPNLIEYRMLSNETRLDALENRTVDIVVKTMSITCERLKVIDFSVPYFAASQQILAYRNSGIFQASDLAGKTVCATRASTSIARVQRAVPSAKYVTTGSWADCLVMMQQGQVEAITSDNTILAGIAVQDPWVHVVGDSLGTENYGVGIPKGEEDLVRFVNGVLAQREADGSWQRSYTEWLSLLGPGFPPTMTYRD